MTTILHIQTSSNLNSSVTRQIGPVALDALKTTYPNAKVIERDLAKNPVPHLLPETLNALFSGNADAPELALSNQLIAELFESDILLLEVPMYNFGIPSVLKAWVDHVARAGKTFRYTETGPVGLLTGKKAILVLGSGGIYSEGPYKPYDHSESYLRTILAFIGITDVEVVAIEGVALGAEKAAAALETARRRVTDLTATSKAA